MRPMDGGAGGPFAPPYREDSAGSYRSGSLGRAGPHLAPFQSASRAPLASGGQVSWLSPRTAADLSAGGPGMPVGGVCVDGRFVPPGSMCPPDQWGGHRPVPPHSAPDGRFSCTATCCYVLICCASVAAAAAFVAAAALAATRWRRAGEVAQDVEGVIGAGSPAWASGLTEDQKVVQSYARFGSEHGGWLSNEAANSFAGRPPLSEWRGRLERSVLAGQGDPCAADVVSSMGWTAGFGSRMNSFIDDLWVAVYKGLSVSICGTDEFVENVWRKHFDNALNLGICLAPVCRELSSHEWKEQGAWAVGFWLTPKLATVDHHYISSLKRYLASLVFTMNLALSGLVNETLRLAWASQQITMQEPWDRYLGVHIRHGDKYTETSTFSIDEYAAMIRPNLQQNNLSMVYVASDDDQAAGILRERLDRSEGVAKVVEQQRLADSAYQWNEVYEDEASLQALLADIEGLRRAKVFLGTASSNIGRLVYCLRDESSLTYSLDEDNDFLIVHPMR